MYTCRECENEVNQATELCPHCGADLTLAPDDGSIPKKKPTVAKVLLRWGLLMGVLMAAMWSFLWFVVSPRTGQVTLEAETHAVQALGDVYAALVSYEEAQGGAYPANLEALGTPVRQAAQMAQSDGYQLEYTPGPAGADGAIHGYSLEARAGNYGYRNFYTDASGIVRATSENRSATALDPPIH
jgi:hypothetical protein